MSPLEDRSTTSWDDPLPYAIAAPRRRRKQEPPFDKLEDDKLEDDEASEGDIAHPGGAIVEALPGSPRKSARSFHSILVVDDEEQTLRLWKRSAREYTIH